MGGPAATRQQLESALRGAVSGAVQSYRRQLARVGNGLAITAARAAENLRTVLTERLTEWRALLERHPEQARQTVLKPLLGTERFVMTPDGGAPGVTRTPGTQFRKSRDRLSRAIASARLV